MLPRFPCPVLAPLLVLFGCEGGHGVLTTLSATDTGNATGTTGPGSDTTGAPGCGNGAVEPPEACDDGNALEGDGCNNKCQFPGTMVWCKYDIGEDGGPNAGYAVAVDAQGDVVVVGGAYTQQSGQVDGFAAKYRGDGTLAWLHDIPDSSHATGVVVDSADHITVAVTIGVNSSLVRLSPAGEVLWTRPIAGEYKFVGNNLAMAPSGAVALMGTALGEPNRAWLAGIDADGAILWQSTLDDVDAETEPSALAADRQGNWLLVGTIVAKTVAPEGDVGAREITDGFVRKHSSEGDPLWTKVLSPDSDDASISLEGVGEDESQRVIVVGNVEGADSVSGMQATFTAGGELLTEISLDIPSAFAFVHGMIHATDSDVLVMGRLQQPGDVTSSGYVARFRDKGAPLWIYTSALVTNRFSAFSAAARRRPGALFITGIQNIPLIAESRAIVCKLEP